MAVADPPVETPESIDFSLSEEQRAIREAAREFARKEIDPIA